MNSETIEKKFPYLFLEVIPALISATNIYPQSMQGQIGKVVERVENAIMAVFE